MLKMPKLKFSPSYNQPHGTPDKANYPWLPYPLSMALKTIVVTKQNMVYGGNYEA